MASQRGEVPAAVRVRAGQPVGKARRGTSGGDSVGVTSGGGDRLVLYEGGRGQRDVTGHGGSVGRKGSRCDGWQGPQGSGSRLWC